MLVWIDGWQMQCCGAPFAVGSEVEWNLYEDADHDWLDSVVGPDLSADVTHGEDHHDTAPGETQLVAGAVRRIRAVSSAVGPAPRKDDAEVVVPIPGTAQLHEVTRADGWFPEDDRVIFNGYLVDLEPE